MPVLCLVVVQAVLLAQGLIGRCAVFSARVLSSSPAWMSTLDNRLSSLRPWSQVSHILLRLPARALDFVADWVERLFWFVALAISLWVRPLGSVFTFVADPPFGFAK